MYNVSAILGHVKLTPASGMSSAFHQQRSRWHADGVERKMKAAKHHPIRATDRAGVHRL